MTNDEMIKGLQLLDDNLTQFDELCGSDGKWVDVHELIWETVEALQAKEIRDDCISKDQVITAICERYVQHERKGELQFYTCEIKQEMVNLIQDLPSVKQLVDTRDKADAAAHLLMDFDPHGKPDSERIGEYNIIYHGDRLYSVRRVDRDAVVLLHANSPHDAWRKAVEMYEQRF